MPRFVVKMPTGEETSFAVEENDIFIGRVPTINDICLNDASVSRQHAHVKRREEGFTIYDLKSLNGVILNGARVARALLKDGDRIRIGNVTVLFEAHEITSDEELKAIEDSEKTEAAAAVSSLEEVTRKTKIPKGPRGRKSGRKRPKPRHT
jgi:pSer/pThr/pTyr-binding forkhead associated (FHA) protein